MTERTTDAEGVVLPAGPAAEAAEMSVLDTHLNEEHFRLMVEGVRDYAILGLDTTGHVTSWNVGAQHIKGYRGDEIIGKHFSTFYAPEDLATGLPDAELVIATAEGRFEGEGWRVRKDGTQFFANVVITALRDEHGKLRGFGKVTRDITERQAGEQALRASEERFRLMVEGVRDYAILGLDTTGHVTSWNVGAQHIKGYRGDEIIGKHFSTFYTPEDLATGLPDAELVIATAEGRFEGEGWRVRKDGTQFFANVVITALRDEHGKLRGFGKVTRDITERQAGEQALCRAAARLRVANDVLQGQAAELCDARDLAQRSWKAAEDASRQKSAFLANMSHEIRTPMNAVIGMTGLLLDTPLGPEQREFVETVRSSGDLLLGIINDILDFSKIEADGLELEHLPFDLQDCVESSVDLVAATAAAKGLELVCHVDDRCPSRVVGDITRFRQVLVNVLSNAVKFTERGEVLIDVGCEALDGAGARLRISVADTGVGIPADRIGSLFDSFSQVDAATTRVYGGTGLGLAITKRLVETMNGAIEVQSLSGAGTTFSFSVLLGCCADTPSALKPAAARLAQGRSVLVVDDNSTNRRIIRLQLEGWGMIVTEAASGSAALQLIDSGASFDIALLDMKMPGMTGRELAVSLRSCPATKLLPLILLSSYGERRQEPTLFSAVLNKPTRRADLRESLMQATAPGTTAAPPNWRPSPTTPPPREQIRVLLAEDNPINQRVGKLMLEKLGQLPDLVANGAEAAQAVSLVSYDLVLMDLQMPEMDGLEATRIIRGNPAIDRQPRIVALTANALVEDRNACVNAGMDDYLAKPLRLKDLEAELDKALNRIRGYEQHTTGSAVTRDALGD